MNNICEDQIWAESSTVAWNSVREAVAMTIRNSSDFQGHGKCDDVR